MAEVVNVMIFLIRKQFILPSVSVLNIITPFKKNSNKWDISKNWYQTSKRIECKKVNRMESEHMYLPILTVKLEERWHFYPNLFFLNLNC